MSAAKINFQYLEVDLERLVRIVANTDAFNNIFKGREKMAIKEFIDEIEMLYNIIVNSVTPFYQLSDEGLFKIQFPIMFSNFQSIRLKLDTGKAKSKIEELQKVMALVPQEKIDKKHYLKRIGLSITIPLYQYYAIGELIKDKKFKRKPNELYALTYIKDTKIYDTIEVAYNQIYHTLGNIYQLQFKMIKQNMNWKENTHAHSFERRVELLSHIKPRIYLDRWY